MSDANTTNVSTTGEGTVNNDVDTEGAVNQTANTDEKKFNQSDVDAIIKRKQAEWRDKSKKEFEKSLEGKLVLTETDVQAKVNAAIEDYKKAAALESVKVSIKANYDLTEEQVARLVGDTAEELQADAEKIYGALKKKDAPKLPTGNKPVNGIETNDPIELLNERLRKRIK